MIINSLVRVFLKEFMAILLVTFVYIYNYFIVYLSEDFVYYKFVYSAQIYEGGSVGVV